MPRPSRQTTDGRVYNDLRQLARRANRLTDDLMLEYVLERFLYRLSVCDEAREHFILKGGLLLAQFGARRMTRDIDILGRAFSADADEIIRRVAVIASTEVDDGVSFNPESLGTVPIRLDDEYGGLRLSMSAMISRAQLKLQLDVSFGDPVTPDPEAIHYPQLLSTDTFCLNGYPLATVIAEKLTTCATRGSLNTRDRDYADLYQIVTKHALDGDQILAALTATAAHRGVRLRSLRDAVADLAKQRQGPYSAWRARQGGAQNEYPEQFGDVLNAVAAFAEMALSGEARGWVWRPDVMSWLPSAG